MPGKSAAKAENAVGVVVDWSKRDTDLIHEGTRIVLPDTPAKMPLEDAITTLTRLKADEETLFNTSEVLDAFPPDALVAVNAAMRDIYGWASPQPTPGFFGPKPPQFVSVRIGPKPGDVLSVAYGNFKLPNVSNNIGLSVDSGRWGLHLVINGKVNKAERLVVQQLAARAREFLATGSIYRGRAIKLPANSDGALALDPVQGPEFIDTDWIVPSDLILNRDELEQVRTALWAPIQHTAEAVRNGIPLKRGVLFEGPYGTGKSLTAAVTARVAVDSGWTYILLEDVRALRETLEFARRYQPAVVFAEDVDRVADKRDQAGNDLLNIIDGVLAKDSQVITVLTTNHVERLEVAMLRPGRLDAVISVRPPDAESVGRLIHLYSRGRLAAGTTLGRVSAILEGNIPSTIREVVERSKLAMIADSRDHVTEDDLITAAKGMARHLELLREKAPTITPFEALGRSFAEVTRDTMVTTVRERLTRDPEVDRHLAKLIVENS